MQRIVSTFLFVLMACLGTGLLPALHMMQHERQHALADAMPSAATHTPPAPTHKPEPCHDDDCPICRQFHAPIVSLLNTVGLIDTGTSERCIAKPAIDQQSQAFPGRHACRGPPVPTC